MSISVAELEAILSVNAEKFNSGIQSVKSKLGEVESSMKNLNTGGIAFGTLLGNLGSRVIGGAFNMLKNAGKDALEYASYNEGVRISLDSITQADLKRTNGMVEYVKIGEKTVQVQGHFQQAAVLSGKALDKQNKLIEKAHDAVAKLDLAEARYQQKQNKPPVKTKKETDQQYQDRLNVYNKTFPVLDNNIAKLNKTIAAGSNLNAPKWVDAYSKVVPIMQKVQHETLTDAQIKAQAAETTKKAIRSLELMAIDSKYDKKDMVDSFSLLRTMGTYANDQALKIQQGITDIASVRGLDGSGLQRIANVYAAVGAKHRVYWQDIKQMAATAPGFMQKLADQMGVKVEALKKMSSKGLIPQEAFEKTMNGLFEEYKGKAKEMARTLPGLISSFKDLRFQTLSNFFTPIFESFKPALEGIVDLLKDSGIQNRIAAAGERIGKTITGIFERANKIIGPIVAAISTNGLNLGSIISGLSTALSQNAIPDTWGGALVTVLTFIRDHGPAISAVLTAVGTAMAGLMIASQVSSVMGTLSTVLGALASPIGIIGAAIGLLYVGFQTNFLGIRDTLLNFWKDIKPFWDNFLSLVTNKNGSINWANLFNLDETGLIKPVVDFIAGIPQTLSDAISKLNQGDITGMFEKLWGGFGLKGLNVVNAISEFIGTVTGDIAKNAPKIVTAFAGWGTAALGWLNKSQTELFNSITAPDGLIENIGAALGNAVDFLAKVLNPWLKQFAGKVLTPEEKEMKDAVEGFVNRIGDNLNTAKDGIVKIAKVFVSSFWKAAGENVTEGIDNFWTGFKNTETPAKMWERFSSAFKDDKGNFNLSTLFFGGKGEGKNALNTLTGHMFDFTPEEFWQFQKDSWDHIVKGGPNPKSFSIPMNVTMDIKNLEDQNTPAAMIQAYMDANGIYKVGGDYFYDLGMRGKTLSTAGTYTPVKVPVKPEIDIAAPGTGGLGNGAIGPSKVMSGLDLVQQAMSGITLSQDANGLVSNPVNVKMPITLQPDITAPTDTVSVQKKFWDSIFPTGTATIAADNKSATLPKVDVTMPIELKTDVTMPTATSPTTGQPNANLSDTLAANAGLQKGTDGNYTLPNASSVSVSVPVNVALGLPTLGKGDATSKENLDSIVKNYLISAGITTDANGAYTYSGSVVDITIPIRILTTNGNAQSQGAGGNTQSPIIQGLIDSITSDTNKASMSEAIGGLYSAALATFITKNQLNADAKGGANQKSLAYTVGGQIGSGIAAGLKKPVEEVVTALDGISKKITSIQDTDVPNMKTAMGSLNAYLTNVAKPEMDTFRTGPLFELNNEFARQKTLIEGIITALGNYKTALAGFTPPNLSGGSGTGSGNTREDRTVSFSNPGFSNGSENRTATFTIVSTIDSDQLSRKTYHLVNNKFLQEVGDY